MPLQIAETTGIAHDGPVGEQLTDKRFITVEDRAYFKIKRIDEFVEDTRKFVIRMKENVQIVESYHMKVNESADYQIISDVSFQRQLIENQLSKDWMRALNQFLKKIPWL